MWSEPFPRGSAESKKWFPRISLIHLRKAMADAAMDEDQLKLVWATQQFSSTIPGKASDGLGFPPPMIGNPHLFFGCKKATNLHIVPILLFV